MLRNLAFVVGYAVIQVLSTTASVWAADFGTAEEAKAMLEKAVVAVKEDKAKALDMFIPTSRVHICKTSKATRAIRLVKR